jgi:hypothetical protein
MIKKILLLLLFSTTLFSKEKIEVKQENIFVKKCVPCHEYLPSSLERMFMSYLKVYSGEKTFKESLKSFLRDPDEVSSTMSELFLDRFGVKSKTELSDKELEEAVNLYWEMYNIRNKLK